MINLKAKDSVADAVKDILQQEALKGQQHQIDKNKNKKIDAQDFAILRGEKKPEVKKEEVEQIDELKKSTVKSYLSKKMASLPGKNPKKDQESMMKAHHRVTGVKPTSEEVELDEREMTAGETAEKERIVKGMKKSLSGFKARYGEKAKNVMYATATKQAMKEEEQVDEANSPFDWKKPREPEVKGGAGFKPGRAYGGAAQKSKPEQEDEKAEKKKVNEAKRPESDDVPFAGPYNTSSSPANVVDKSGATHTPMSRVKHLAKMAMKKVNKDLGKK